MHNGNFSWGYGSVRDDLVLSHPAMQHLRGIKQLGQIEALHPGATHTRYDHSGYAMAIAHAICDVLESKGRLPASRNDIVQYTKLHDYGHPPFSHAVEYVLREETKLTHNLRALQLLDSPQTDGKGRTLREVLEYSGADVDNLRRLLQGTDPASAICRDKTVGADKLAYTHMDAVKCEFDQTPPLWQVLIPFFTFYNGGLGLEVRVGEEHQRTPIGMLCAIQDFYFRMYTEVYLSPESLVLERHIQKAVELAIQGGIFSATEVWDLSDGALVHQISHAVPKNELIRQAQYSLQGFTQAGDCFMPAVAFKYEPYTVEGIQRERIVPLEKAWSLRFLETFSNPHLLTRLEEDLERELKIPFLCSVLPDPEKVRSSDVPLYDRGTKVATLQELRPKHFEKLEEQARSFFAIRLSTSRDRQEDAVRRWEEVRGYFYEKATGIMEKTA